MNRTDRSPTTVVRVLMLCVALAALLHQSPAAAQSGTPARTVYAVTADNQLVSFSSTTPATLSTPVAITGLQASETIAGIDFRPLDGRLYALGSTGRLYALDTTSGAATLVGSGPLNPAITGAAFGFDFNPAADRLRIVSDADQNLRIVPTTGVPVVDGALAYAGTDANAGANPNVVAAAYTNNFAAAGATALFVIDSTLNTLALQNPPNAGTLNTVGALGVDVTENAAFDIVGAGNEAYAALTPAGATTASWYRVNLSTGAATLVGAFGVAVRAVAVVPTAADTIYALTAGNRLLTFRASAPGTITGTLAVTGLQDGENLLGIDFRPADGRLYALGSSGRLYTLDTFSGAATPVGSGPLSPAISGTAFGFDFNPQADRLRIVSDTDQNLRVNPVTGAPLVDGTLAYASTDANAGANPNVAGAGYTNNISGTTSTQLFVVDTALDVLALQNPPNAGTLTTVGPLGVDVTDQFGFDIARNGEAYVAFSAPAGTSSSFGTINTATGAVSSIGTIGGGELIRDIAVPTWQYTLFLPVIFK
jgi:hypothetical protein